MQGDGDAAAQCRQSRAGLSGSCGRGVEFFPAVEPEVAQIQVESRDNPWVREKDDLVRRAEAQVFGIEGIDHIHARTIGGQRGASERAMVARFYAATRRQRSPNIVRTHRSWNSRGSLAILPSRRDQRSWSGA